MAKKHGGANDDKALQELLALTKLHAICPGYCDDFVKHEGPDWVNSGDSIGLEVSTGIDENKWVMDKFLGKHSGETFNDLIGKISNLPGALSFRSNEFAFRYTPSNDLFECPRLYPDPVEFHMEKHNLSPEIFNSILYSIDYGHRWSPTGFINLIMERFKKKMEKLNNSYLRLNHNILFIFGDLMINVVDDRLERLRNGMTAIRNGYKTGYDVVYLDVDYALIEFDMNSDGILLWKYPNDNAKIDARRMNKNKWTHGTRFGDHIND